MNWLLLKNSLLVAGVSSLVAVIIGSLAALCLAGLTEGWRRWGIGGALAALALPPFLVTNSWLDLLGRAGILRPWVPFDIFSLGGTIWILALLLWPIPALLVLAELHKLEPGQLESDPCLRGRALLYHLVLPLARPALGQGLVITFVLALNNFAVPSILQTKVFPAELWVNFNTTFDYASSLRLSWPLLLFPLLLLLLLRARPVTWPRRVGPFGAALFRRQLGQAWWAGAAVVLLVFLVLSVAIPVGQLAFAKRTWLELPGALAAGQGAVLNSLGCAAAGASLCLLAGLLTWRWRLGALGWLLLLEPGVLLGMALIFAFNRPWFFGIYESLGIVVLALGVRFAVLGWTGARRALESVDPILVDFARLHGANRWQLWRHARIPQIARPMSALWFVLYLLCLWEVETLVLIMPPGGETLALRIFNLLHYGHNAQVNALCLLLLGLAVLPLALSGLGQFVRAGWARRPPMALLACLSLTAALLLTACRPPGNQATLNSRFFSRVQVIGARGTALGQFNKPRSLALDAQDNLYVVDMTGRVQKFDSNGVYLTSWQMPQIEKGRPKGMCRDSLGNIVVVEPHYARVNHFSPDGKLVAQWGRYGTNAGQLTMPRGAVVDSHGNLFVCEYTLVDCVLEFTALGKKWIRTFGRSGLGPGELNRPEGLAEDKHDQLYVADSCNHRIQIFSPEGKFLREYGRAGAGPGELSYPYDIKLDADGNQYVCEFGNSRIQIFDPSGRSLEILGRAGAAPGQFSNPWSIAFDSAGNLYVADSQNHRVQKFFRRAAVARAGATRVLAEPRSANGGQRRAGFLSLAPIFDLLAKGARSRSRAQQFAGGRIQSGDCVGLLPRTPHVSRTRTGMECGDVVRRSRRFGLRSFFAATPDLAGAFIAFLRGGG